MDLKSVVPLGPIVPSLFNLPELQHKSVRAKRLRQRAGRCPRCPERANRDIGVSLRRSIAHCANPFRDC